MNFHFHQYLGTMRLIVNPLKRHKTPDASLVNRQRSLCQLNETIDKMTLGLNFGEWACLNRWFEMIALRL